MFDINLIKKLCPVKKGKAYRGFLAKNKTKEHNVIIVCIKNEKVYWFCIDSSENTKNFFRKIDNQALVILTKDEQKKYWEDSTKESYVFCGELGFCPSKDEADKTLESFIEDLSLGAITPLNDCPDSLLQRIERAIADSKTLSKDHKDLLK